MPGQRLVEYDLSEEYGVTRSAVREALRDLAAEEVVEIIPRRGARVRVVSVEEAVQATECRSALGQLCAGRRRTAPTTRTAPSCAGSARRRAVSPEV